MPESLAGLCLALESDTDVISWRCNRPQHDDPVHAFVEFGKARHQWSEPT